MSPYGGLWRWFAASFAVKDLWAHEEKKLSYQDRETDKPNDFQNSSAEKWALWHIAQSLKSGHLLMLTFIRVDTVVSSTSEVCNKIFMRFTKVKALDLYLVL